jgi:hypothetical protein
LTGAAGKELKLSCKMRIAVLGYEESDLILLFASRIFQPQFSSGKGSFVHHLHFTISR